MSQGNLAIHCPPDIDGPANEASQDTGAGRSGYLLSTDDVRALEAEPGYCPASYHVILNFLKRNIRLLTVLFGAGCSHLTEVQGVYQVLAEKITVYETMPRRCGKCLWTSGSASATWGLASRSPSSIRSGTTFKAAPYECPSIARWRSY